MAFWRKFFIVTFIFVVSEARLLDEEMYDFLSDITISSGINRKPDSTGKTPLYILGFFPLDGPMTLLGNVSKISAELALEHINKDDTVLKDFDLRMIVKDSKDDEGYAVNSLFAIKNEFEPNILMIIGPLRNELSEAIGRVLKYWKIPQISYGSHSPLLTDFTNFYRTIPSSVGMNNPRIKMMQKWNWNLVASLSSNGKVFNTISQNLVRELNLNNITLISKDSFDHHQPTASIALLKEKDARIIVGNFYEFDAVAVFCDARKVGLYGPNIVWLVYGHFESNWWNPVDLHLYNCTPEEMLESIEGHFAIRFEVIGDEPGETIGRITPHDYRTYILNKTGVDLGISSKPAPYAYDAVWAGALAINASYAELGMNGLTNFSDPTNRQADVLIMNMNSTQFDGVS